MSSSTIFTVPEGMSCVNAFRALWERSKPAPFLMLRPDIKRLEEEAVATAEKVAAIFTTHTSFDYTGGRLLKMNFASFPKLDARLYDREFGAGAAQKAVERYNNINPSERFDKNDSYKFEKLAVESKL